MGDAEASAAASRRDRPTTLRQRAVADFKDSIARDPAFVELKIGAGSSLGYLREVLFQISWSRGVVEAVNRSAPQRKSTPVEYPRCQLVVFWDGRELVVKAAQSWAVAFIVRPR